MRNDVNNSRSFSVSPDNNPTRALGASLKGSPDRMQYLPDDPSMRSEFGRCSASYNCTPECHRSHCASCSRSSSESGVDLEIPPGFCRIPVRQKGGTIIYRLIPLRHSMVGPCGSSDGVDPITPISGYAAVGSNPLSTSARGASW